MTREAALETQDPVFVILETAFGNINVHRDTIINFPQGILGFDGCHYFAIMEVPGHAPDSPHRLLQSLEVPKLCLIITPVSVGKDAEHIHEKDVQSYLEEQHMTSSETNFWCILSFDRTNPAKTQITANLKAPLMINTQTLQGWQIILYHADYPVDHPLGLNEI